MPLSSFAQQPHMNPRQITAAEIPQLSIGDLAGRGFFDLFNRTLRDSLIFPATNHGMIVTGFEVEAAPAISIQMTVAGCDKGRPFLVRLVIDKNREQPILFSCPVSTIKDYVTCVCDRLTDTLYIPNDVFRGFPACGYCHGLRGAGCRPAIESPEEIILQRHAKSFNDALFKDLNYLLKPLLKSTDTLNAATTTNPGTQM